MDRTSATEKTYRVDRIGLGLLGVAGFWILRLTTSDWGYGDAGRYTRLVEHPGTIATMPWDARIAVPLVASGISRATGMTAAASLTLLTVVAYALIVPLLYALLRARRIPRVPALSAAAISLVSFPAIYHAHNSVHIGMWEYLFITLGCLLISQEAWWKFGALLGVSGFVKESIGALIPVAFLEARKGQKSERWRAVLAGTAVFLLAVITLRSGILMRPAGPSEGAGAPPAVTEVWKFYGGPAGFAREAIGAFGLFWPLVLAGWFHDRRTTGAFPMLIATGALACLVATDVKRMICLALPAAALAWGIFLRDARPGLREAAVFLGIAGTIAQNRFQPPNSVYAVLLALQTLLVYLALRPGYNSPKVPDRPTAGQQTLNL